MILFAWILKGKTLPCIYSESIIVGDVSWMISIKKSHPITGSESNLGSVFYPRIRGIKPPAVWLVDDLLCLLSDRHPNIMLRVVTIKKQTNHRFGTKLLLTVWRYEIKSSNFLNIFFHLSAWWCSVQHSCEKGFGFKSDGHTGSFCLVHISPVPASAFSAHPKHMHVSRQEVWTWVLGYPASCIVIDGKALVWMSG